MQPTFIIVVDLELDGIDDKPQPANALAVVGSEDAHKGLLVTSHSLLKPISGPFYLLHQIDLSFLLLYRARGCFVYLVCSILNVTHSVIEVFLRHFCLPAMFSYIHTTMAFKVTPELVKVLGLKSVKRQHFLRCLRTLLAGLNLTEHTQLAFQPFSPSHCTDCVTYYGLAVVAFPADHICICAELAGYATASNVIDADHNEKDLQLITSV
mmetsp:Transcript_103427/g.179491  ORF Transcript_103427/g.179491 Transcript_103427/m.179491 type:complete len:210 (+) Transcript_103427:918-1547(+)